jgi:histidinol-phosphate/aromatic aminotransferase/cobyric acid decarboxylase-like protein
VDEAYVEFAGVESLAQRVRQMPQLAVLRTLSKAYALAGARCGAVIAAAEVIALLRKVITPYALSQLTIESVLGCLAEPNLDALRERVAAIQAERERLVREIGACRLVARVWPSAANFLLVEFIDTANAAEALKRTCAAGLLIRDMRRQPGLDRALRISIGSSEQNDRLLEALQ